MEPGDENPEILPAFPSLERTPFYVCVRAPAKINLDLRVGRRRPDGYHSIDSIVAKVTLYDELIVERRPDEDVGFSCPGEDCGADEQNLAFLAAKDMTGRIGRCGADVRLHKEIPVGRGLGGGSADAAATLFAVARIWGVRLSPAQLKAMGAELGSDVPLFFGPSASRITRRGERVKPVEVHDFVAMLFLPPFACRTADVYEQYDRKERKKRRRPFDASVLADPPSRWRHLLRNDLFDAAVAACPALGRFHTRLADALDVPVCLTGSGSGLFALFDDEAELAAAWTQLPRDLDAECVAVRRNPW